MFKSTLSLEQLNTIGNNTMVEHLGIKFVEVGTDYLVAHMPVDHRTHQPYGLLHGGASVALAETLGSLAAWACVDDEKYMCVGLDINANHVRGITEGYVVGKATPVHVGKTTHVWQIHITNPQGKLVCISRITMAILPKKR